MIPPSAAGDRQATRQNIFNRYYFDAGLAERACSALCSLLSALCSLLSAPCLQQRLDELLWIKIPQIFDRFSDAHELDRDGKLPADGKDDAPFRCPVELREHNARYPERLVEHLRLGQGVLALVPLDH